MKNIFFLFIVLSLVIACSKKEEDTTFNLKHMVTAKKGDFKNNLAAKIGKIEITYEELYQGIENEIFEGETKVYKIKKDRLRALTLKKLMMNHPGKKGLSNDQFLEKYISKSKKPSEKDVLNFIKERGIGKETVNATMKERIVEFLWKDKKKKDVDIWLSKQTKINPVEVYFVKPERPKFKINVGNAPFYGNKNAKVTVVVYSDFQCPFSAKGSKIFKKIQDKYGQKVKLVFKHFPLPFHIFAQKSSEASLCVHQQTPAKFWDIHYQMFNNQTELSKDGLKKLAKKVGVDQKKFDDCLASDNFKEAVLKDFEEGKKLGVKSTPTFFVNGKIITGAVDFRVFEKLIDDDLKM